MERENYSLSSFEINVSEEVYDSVVSWIMDYMMIRI